MDSQQRNMDRVLKLLKQYWTVQEVTPAIDCYQFPGMVVLAFATTCQSVCLKFYTHKYLLRWLRKAEKHQRKKMRPPEKQECSLEQAFGDAAVLSRMYKSD